jgi:short-subunit dehydrogenase
VTLRGKVVLITGGSEGIGAACARVFRERDASLSLIARNEAKLRQVARNDDLLTAGDITDAATRQAVVARTLKRYGRIDVLVNNAGIGLYAPAWHAPIADARRMMELNFFAALELTQLVVPYMREQRGGAIVNISSIAGKMTLPWFTLYSASKYALGSLTDGLRMELGRDGIHAMTVCPGYVRTNFQENVLAGRAPESLRGARSQFAITADECARAIVRGLERDARTIVTPATGWALIAAARLFPAAVDRVLERIYHAQGS